MLRDYILNAMSLIAVYCINNLGSICFDADSSSKHWLKNTPSANFGLFQCNFAGIVTQSDATDEVCVSRPQIN